MIPKEKLLLLTLLFCVLNVSAQVKLRIEGGFLLETDSENLGLLFNIEPKIKTTENTVLGLRFGIAVNPPSFKIDDDSQFFIDDSDDNGLISFATTFDYYFNQNNYYPYIGLGLGYYLFNQIDVFNRNNSTDVLDGSVNNQIGFLLRGGLESGNVRFGLEYNFIPKAAIKILNNQIVGTVDNSYFGISIGFIIVGRERF